MRAPSKLMFSPCRIATVFFLDGLCHELVERLCSTRFLCEDLVIIVTKSGHILFFLSWMDNLKQWLRIFR